MSLSKPTLKRKELLDMKSMIKSIQEYEDPVPIEGKVNKAQTKSIK